MTSAELISASSRSGALELTVLSGESSTRVRANSIVNAAGLHASRVASALECRVPDDLPETRYAKGNYFSYQGRSPFTHLIYPLPVAGGLGIHATLDLAGKLRFGPDVEWVDALDYTVDPARARSFAAAIRSYWPGVKEENLQPSYAGVRPKLHGPNEAAADFLIRATEAPGGTRIVHLIGIESPGLTASLAIGAYVSAKLQRN